MWLISNGTSMTTIQLWQDPQSSPNFSRYLRSLSASFRPALNPPLNIIGPVMVYREFR